MSRHWKPLSALALLAVAVATSAMAIGRGRAVDPRPTVDAARAAAVRAEIRLAASAPEESKRIRQLGGLAELFPSVDPARNWAPVLVAAHRALVAVELGRRDGESRWAAIEPRAALAVARSLEDRKLPGLGGREVAAAERAATGLGVARGLADSGELERAVLVAEAAIAEAERVSKSSRELLARFDRPDLRRQWRAWVEDTIADSRRHRSTAIVVSKLERRLDLYRRGQRVASFPVELGARGLHRKLHAGDRATPEGVYRISQVKLGRQTKYYKALLIDYPNSDDQRRYREARQRGDVPRGSGIGSLIEIHGDGGQGRDWTDGCIALTNSDMDRLLAHISRETPVTIVGTLGESGTAKRANAR